MSRLFAYCRVSTVGQTNENQVLEIKSAGFDVQPQRIIEETVSGSVPASQRKGFQKLLERMEPEDVLVVTRLDRLGRDVTDVRSTVEKLSKLRIRVHCLALGGVDLTSSAGKLTMTVIAAVSEMEKNLLVERTMAGLNRAKAEGKILGRPKAVNVSEVELLKNKGLTQKAAADELQVSLSTIKRLWNAAA